MGSNHAGVTADAALAVRARPAGLALLMAMRPYQWPKNAIVLAALAFSAGEAWTLGEPGSWWPLAWRSLVMAALWCLTASGVYLLNDVQDREADRVHPRKRSRPVAAGEVGAQTAVTAAVVLFVVAIPSAFAVDVAAGAILAGYAAVMVTYNLGLKQIAILDVLILCGGVVARTVSGAVVIGVEISPWLYVCSSFAAFFLGSSKRWAEYRQLGPEAAAHRPALAHYSGELLSQLTIISAATALLSYALYTIESEHVPANGAMALTVPFVAFGLFRYLLLLHGPRSGDAPDRILFTDPQILVAVLGFVVVAVGVLLTQ
jgi:4-hydroxybenzoate polyprenyltransferase